MNTNYRQQKGMLRETLSAVLVLALLAPALGAQERRGAQLEVTKTNGTVVLGELLAVKGTDLLIMDGSTQGGVSVSLADAKLVKVIKRGKAGMIVAGALIGGAVGAGVGYAVESGNHGFLSGIPKAAGTIVGGGIGILGGGILGLVMGSSKKITIYDWSPKSLELTASQLRKLARDQS